MRSKKVVATIGTGPMAPVLDVSRPTMVAYAERHGYDFVEGDGESDGRPPSWGKLLLFRRLLTEYETVLWIDADAIVLDGSSDIADELGPDDYQGLVCHETAEDWWGHFGNPGEQGANCGVWLLRGQRARDFVEAVWASDAFIHHQWWENAAVLTLLGFGLTPVAPVRETEWSMGTVWLDPTWNGHTMYTGLEPARIRHYAGVDNRMRIRRMHADLGRSNVPAAAWRAYWHLRMRGWLPLSVGKGYAKHTVKRALRRA